MFDKILIANRGEIALRILRAAKELGIATVAVHSTADADAMHVQARRRERLHRAAAGPRKLSQHPGAARRLRDHRRRRGPSRLRLPVRERALRRNPRASTTSPSSARSPSISASWATRSRPSARRGASAFRACRARTAASPTTTRPSRIAEEIGYPVLVKAAAGGGGRGMKVARRPERPAGRARDAPARRPRPPSATMRSISRNISRSRAISRSRCWATASGNAIHLGERDCSLQRRHQKVWEEGPSPALNADAARRRSARSAPRPCASSAIVGAGTVEFLYEDGEFYFIEMNTRIQVEHPVTEMITGIDLVNEQIKIAAGSPLTDHAGGRPASGPRHRVPDQRRASRDLPALARHDHLLSSAGRPRRSRRFAPSTRATRSRRIYDSLVGKLIVHGRTRNECLMRLRRALDEFIIDGIDTTLPLFRTLVRNPDMQNGLYDIHWLENFLEDGGMSGSEEELRFLVERRPGSRGNHAGGPAEGLCVRHLSDGRRRGGPGSTGSSRSPRRHPPRRLRLRAGWRAPFGPTTSRSLSTAISRR